MNPFSESSYETDDTDSNVETTQVKVNKGNYAIREFISSVLFTCSGETTQYEETISALEDSLMCYLHHLSQESIRVAKNPSKISSEDVILALKEYPQLQNYMISLMDDRKSIKNARNKT